MLMAENAIDHDCNTLIANGVLVRSVPLTLVRILHFAHTELVSHETIIDGVLFNVGIESLDHSTRVAADNCVECAVVNQGESFHCLYSCCFPDQCIVLVISQLPPCCVADPVKALGDDALFQFAYLDLLAHHFLPFIHALTLQFVEQNRFVGLPAVFVPHSSHLVITGFALV
jgi:hypothetical protein